MLWTWPRTYQGQKNCEDGLINTKDNNAVKMASYIPRTTMIRIWPYTYQGQKCCEHGLIHTKDKNAVYMTSCPHTYQGKSAGMALSRLLPSTNPWGPGDCGRQDCKLCNQQDEHQQDCRKRNVLYENHSNSNKANLNWQLFIFIFQ